MDQTEQTQAPDMVDQAVTNHQKSAQESFAELRKAKDDLERQLWQAQKEREMYEKQLQMQAQYQQKPNVPQEEEFDYRSLEQEEFPDGKRLVKALSQFDKKLSEKDKHIAAANQKILILETASQYKDFNEVVTAENIEKYIKTDEDHCEAVSTAQNPLRKMYNLLKKDARYIKDMEASSKKEVPVSQEQKRVDEREGKPKHTSHGVRSEAVSSAAALSNSTMSKAQRQALWNETQAFARK